MKIGTKSLLVGVHQFIWHPLTVAYAWRRLYGEWPNWHECISIFCHDLGYWGKPNMDGEAGRSHPYVGARIACRIAGWFYCGAERRAFENMVYLQTLYHSREFAKSVSAQPSKLCWADKYCVCLEPDWFYLLRARLSGEIKEYTANAKPIEGELRWIRNHSWDNGKSEAESHWLKWYQQKVKMLPEIERRIKT